MYPESPRRPERRYTWDRIRELMNDAINLQGPILLRCRDILNHYEGEYVIPLPDVSDEPKMPNLTPALVTDAVDFLAQRAASTLPSLNFPAINPNKNTGKRSVEYASIRRRAIAATYDDSMWKIGRRRVFRQNAAYHASAICVLPDWDCERPRIQARDALSAYVEPVAAETLRPPHWIGFVTRFSSTHLRKRFPWVRAEDGGPITDRHTEQMWDVVEWIDEEQIVYGLLGPVNSAGMHVNAQYQNQWGNAPSMPLSPSFDNKTGLVPAVMPHNVTLGRIGARLSALLGNIKLQSKLMALNVVAVERSVFPDMYALGSQMGQPSVVGGSWKDGRSMEINLLSDTTAVGTLRHSPDPTALQMVGQLERNYRTSAHLVPQAGGETYGALRTGRGINELAGIALDPMIQEMHEIDEAWMRHVNQAVLATYKGYWPDKQYSMYSGWPTDQGQVEFTPEEHFETYDNSVSYAIPGADITQVTQITGSLLGAGLISRRTLRHMHPWIGDPDAEGRLIDDEAFEDSVKQAIMQRVVAGQAPMLLLTLVNKYRNDGSDIFEAMEKADTEMRRLQATEAPPPEQGQVAAPEAMPGVEAGPQAMQQPQPGAPGQPIQSFGQVSEMRQLLSQLAGAR